MEKCERRMGSGAWVEKMVIQRDWAVERRKIVFFFGFFFV